MKNAFNPEDAQTSKKLLELKNKSYSKLGVIIFEKDDHLVLAPLEKLETGMLVFDCEGVTLFITENTIKKTGGLNIKYDLSDDSWIFVKNDYKQYVKPAPEPKKSNTKKIGASNKTTKKPSNKEKSLKGEPNV